jgi:hypothetical protein
VARWESTPGADGVTGKLQFGPVAATRTVCPSPHIDERLARDLGFVRSYRFKDGKLFMSLMADTDKELQDAAVQHAVSVHLHEDTQELRPQLQSYSEKAHRLSCFLASSGSCSAAGE